MELAQTRLATVCYTLFVSLYGGSSKCSSETDCHEENVTPRVEAGEARGERGREGEEKGRHAKDLHVERFGEV